jgi:hypothetical protein
MPVYVYIPVSAHYNVGTYDPTLTNYAGNAVQNNNWTYLGLLGDPGSQAYYFQYTGPSLIGALGNSAVGFPIIYSAGVGGGTENVTAFIVTGSGGETNPNNNTSGQLVIFTGH